MPVWVVRLLKILLYVDKDKLVKILIFAIALPLILITVIVVSPIIGVQTIPNIDDKTIKIYVDAAEKAGHGKVIVDWTNLVAIDAVLLKQDFSKTSRKRAEGLANRFVRKKKEKKGKVTYELKSLEEVENELHMADEEKRAVNIFLTIGFGDYNGAHKKGGGFVKGCYKVDKDGEAFITSIVSGAKTTFKKYNVLPSITIAQAILESGCGGSGLSAKYNNLFGIKAGRNWKGKKVLLPTKENKGEKILAFFRVYNSWDESIEDHGKFLAVDNSRYRKHGIFNSITPEAQAQALEDAGYATVQDKNGTYIYAELLMKIIKDNNLMKYDKQ